VLSEVLSVRRTSTRGDEAVAVVVILQRLGTGDSSLH